jgi:hypothetical protein
MNDSSLLLKKVFAGIVAMAFAAMALFTFSLTIVALGILSISSPRSRSYFNDNLNHEHDQYDRYMPCWVGLGYAISILCGFLMLARPGSNNLNI